MRLSRCIIALVGLALLSSCQRDRDPDPRASAPPPPVTVRGEASQASQRLDDLVDDVISAEAPAEEAQRLQRLRNYMVDHDLTYRTRITRTTDTRVIERGASTVSGPLRVEVDISRGRQLLRTFSFVPRDNRNLVSLGQ